MLRFPCSRWRSGGWCSGCWCWGWETGCWNWGRPRTLWSTWSCRCWVIFRCGFPYWRAIILRVKQRTTGLHTNEVDLTLATWAREGLLWLDCLFWKDLWGWYNCFDFVFLTSLRLRRIVLKNCVTGRIRRWFIKIRHFVRPSFSSSFSEIDIELSLRSWSCSSAASHTYSSSSCHWVLWWSGRFFGSFVFRTNWLCCVCSVYNWKTWLCRPWPTHRWSAAH